VDGVLNDMIGFLLKNLLLCYHGPLLIISINPEDKSEELERELTKRWKE